MLYYLCNSTYLSLTRKKLWKDAAIKIMITNNTVSNRKPNSRDDPGVKVYLHQRQRLKLRNGILHRQRKQPKT